MSGKRYFVSVAATAAIVGVVLLIVGCVKAALPTLPQGDFERLEKAMYHADLKTIQKIYKKNKKAFGGYDSYNAVSNAANNKNELDMGVLFMSVEDFECRKVEKVVDFLYGKKLRYRRPDDSASRIRGVQGLQNVTENLCTKILAKIEPQMDFATLDTVNVAFSKLDQRLEIMKDPQLEDRYIELTELLLDANERQCKKMKESGKNEKKNPCKRVAQIKKEKKEYPGKKAKRLRADAIENLKKNPKFLYLSACRLKAQRDKLKETIAQERKRAESLGVPTTNELERMLAADLMLYAELRKILAFYESQYGMPMDLSSCP